MNQKLWATFDKLRGARPDKLEGLAEFLKSEGVRFSAPDLAIWGQFLGSHMARSSGLIHLPEWLAAVFASLAIEVSPKSICDPWAGWGFLVGVLREACRPKLATAYTSSPAQFQMGNVLVSEAT